MGARIGESYIAVPPGETIKELLDMRGITQKEFSIRMNLSEKHVSRLLNGDVILTYDVAERLELVLGVDAGFWNRMEAVYREDLQKIENENKTNRDLETSKNFPYSEMAKYKWVPSTTNKLERLNNLRKFFGVTDLSILKNPQITQVAFRKLGMSEKSDYATLAWIQRAKNISLNMDVEKFNRRRLEQIIREAKYMSQMDYEAWIGELRLDLRDAGVALVELPNLKGSYLQGATFKNGNKYVIALSDRGKSEEKFWFTLYHELGHIIYGHVEKKNGTTTNDEKLVDEWASENLLSTDKIKKYINENEITEKTIKALAKKECISPGIVVERLQFLGYVKHNRFNELKKLF